MNLSDLYLCLAHEQGGERNAAPIEVLTDEAYRYEILSVNWDDEHRRWVICVDPIDYL